MELTQLRQCHEDKDGGVSCGDGTGTQERARTLGRNRDLGATRGERGRGHGQGAEASGASAAGGGPRAAPGRVSVWVSLRPKCRPAAIPGTTARRGGANPALGAQLPPTRTAPVAGAEAPRPAHG